MLARRWDWPDWIYIISANVVWSVGFSVSVVSRRLGRSGVIAPAFAACCALQLAGYLVSLVGYYSLGDAVPAIAMGISIPRVAFKLAVVVWFESRVVDLFFLAGDFLAIAESVVFALVVRADILEHLIHTLASPYLLEIVLALWFRLARASALLAARRLILEDRARYDSIWASVRSGDAAPGALLEVAREASQLEAACEPRAEERLAVLGNEGDATRPALCGGAGPSAVVHLGYLGRETLGSSVGGSDGSADWLQACCGRRVMSLDQLYVQVARQPPRTGSAGLQWV